VSSRYCAVLSAFAGICSHTSKDKFLPTKKCQVGTVRFSQHLQAFAATRPRTSFCPLKSVKYEAAANNDWHGI
jgi:hypothetical protein